MSKKALVIGGGGFLGRHIVQDLLEAHYVVAVFDVVAPAKPWPEVTFTAGDIRNAELLTSVMQGVEVVIHCASPHPGSDNRQLFVDVNIHGTESVIACCKKAGVKKLVLTSSASVVFEGVDLKNVDETFPYASKPIDFYTETKIEQEKIVLKANDGKNFMTCAIRPHGIFGEYDRQLVPTLIDAARRGKTKYMIGDGKNIVDFTYVKNVSYSHILAAEHLTPGSAACGQAFFITNDDPLPFWDFMTRILVGLNYPAPKYHMPYLLVYYIACLVVFFCWLIKPIKHIRPTFSPMRVALAGTYHYYNCSKAKKILNYRPKYTVAEGLARMLPTYPDLVNKPKKD